MIIIVLFLESNYFSWISGQAFPRLNFFLSTQETCTKLKEKKLNMNIWKALV